MANSILTLNQFTTDEFEQKHYTVLKLVNEAIGKINELVGATNGVYEILTYLLEEGLEEEVADVLKEWLNDGTLSQIISEKVLVNIEERFNRQQYDFTLEGGSTANQSNHTQLQALVDKVYELGGGTIYIPKGVYYFEQPVVWKSNVNLKGEGIGLTILKTRGGSANYLTEGFSLLYSEEYGGDVDIEDIEGIQNCSFTNFTINGGELYMRPSYKGKGIFFQKVINCIFNKLRFEETGSTALGVDMLHQCVVNDISCYKCGRTFTQEYNPQGCAGIGIGTNGLPVENLVISNCYTEECGQFGIFIENQAIFGQSGGNPKGVIIENCITVKGKNHGIGIKGGRNITVNNCLSYENVGYGIIIDYNTRLTKITNNFVTENQMGGIAVLNDNYFYNITIDNNYIYMNQGNGIDIIPNHATASKTVTDFIIQNNQIMENTGCGIKVNNHTGKIDNLTIKGNLCYKNGEHGIFIDSITRILNCSNNQCCYNGQTTPETYYGILMDCNITYGNISYNVMYNTSDTNGQYAGLAFISRGGVQKKFVRTLVRSNVSKYHKHDLLCDYDTAELDYGDNDFDIIPDGKISVGNGKMASLPREAFMFSGQGNNVIAIKFKYSETDIFQPIISSYDNLSIGNNPKGWSLVMNTENQLKLVARESTDSTELSVTFDVTLIPDQIYEFRIEFTSSTLSASITRPGSGSVAVTYTLSGSLATILKLLIGFNVDKLLGASYQGISGNIQSGSMVIYSVSTYSNSSNSKFVFNNIGVNKEIKDSRGSILGYALNNATQYFDN